jgi:hypothetical protein
MQEDRSGGSPLTVMDSAGTSQIRRDHADLSLLIDIDAASK